MAAGANTSDGRVGVPPQPGPNEAAPPAWGRRERKKHEVRRRIVDAAETLFSEQGLKTTTVDKIATRADVSQTTFFNYFPTKTALVDALIADLVTLFDGIVERAQGADTPIARTVQSLFEASADLTEVQHRLLRDLIAETIRTSSADARNNLEHMRSVLAQSLEAGQRSGEVRDDRDAGLLADAVLGLYIAVFLFWTTDADYPVAVRLRESITLVMGLIEPRP
jgi:AcrR family transcriptional regulator